MDYVMKVRLTDDDAVLLKKAAEHARMPLSTWARSTLVTAARNGTPAKPINHIVYKHEPIPSEGMIDKDHAIAGSPAAEAMWRNWIRDQALTMDTEPDFTIPSDRQASIDAYNKNFK